MRRAIPIMALAGLVAALAATPALAAQSNTYTVKAKVTRAGVKFAYTVAERAGQQPAAVKRYTIGFGRMRANTTHFAKGALVGKGTISSYVYLSNDPSGAGGFTCTKDLKIYSAGRNRARLVLTGNPARCGGVGDLPPIPAKFVPFAGHGTALQFDVPPNVLHPVPGLTVAVRSVGSSLKAGYMSPIGSASAHRPVAVTFLTEAGQSSTVRTTT